MTTVSSSKDFEAALRNQRKAVLRLELYVSGTTPKSVRAISNLKDICEEFPELRISVKIIDVYQDPAQARRAQVFAVPTLIKLAPQPQKRLIGDLSDTKRVIES